MAYVALKRWKGRAPGDHVPEAAGWKNPDPWVKFGWVKEVPEAEIVNGRWVNYRPPGSRSSVPVPAAPPEPEPAPVAEPEPEEQGPSPRELLEAKTKAVLLAIAGELNLEFDGTPKKAQLVDAILEHGEVVIE